MKLLVADPLEPEALEELRHLGLEVDYAPTLTEATLPSKLGGVGILVVRSTPVTAHAIEAGRALHLIVRAGHSLHTIDTAAASARGIFVAYCPGKNAAAVAELTMGLLCALDRRIPEAIASMRAGKWERGKYSEAVGLHGQTIGLAGFGAVGREVAHRAKAFGMHVVAMSKSLTPQKAIEHGVGFARSLEELASRSQILSIHLPLNDRTRGIVSGSILAALPDGAMIVNTSRADVMDQKALADLAVDKRFRIAIDVHAQDPHAPEGAIDSPLLKLENALIYGTPHIAAQTTQARRATGAEAVRIVRAFVRTGEVPGVVNVCATSPARYQMVIRSLDKVGVLANVLGVLKRHGLNVEELSSTIFDGAVAACTKLRISGRPSDACISEIKAFDEVLHVDALALPNLA
jgi:D-3-phosphoglycerate dehydrogenase